MSQKKPFAESVKCDIKPRPRLLTDFLFLFYCLGHINSVDSSRYCILRCCHLIHRSNINMQFLSRLFTFTDIIDSFCNSFVFNINLCVFDSLSAIIHERQLLSVRSLRMFLNSVFLLPLKIGINKWSGGYFELNLHRHILGTPETYITYCEKGHNWCPL